MENIRDWCISRQLWWGHQIPIWYHKQTGEIYCDVKEPNDIENWVQDSDVLDTWFSSWLWPFSVFGWDNSSADDNNADLNYYYPTDFLCTAADIIFLWVARMIISGLEYRKNIPFKDVYFNAIVRDGKGRKMSKTLGNSPDPLDIMAKYGTDALRFTMVYLAPLGNDVLFDEDNTEIGRNFVTKIWNAGRFLILNKNKIDSSDEYSNEEYEKDFVDKWINSMFNDTVRDVENNLNEYKLNDYTKALYNFVWSDFCDWYIEILKVKIEKNKKSAKRIIDDAIEIFENIILLLHPVIPFVTEEIWHILDESRIDKTISYENFPELDESKIDSSNEQEFESLKEIITGVRNLKADNEIAFSKKCNLGIIVSDKIERGVIDDYYKYIYALGNLDNLEIDYHIDLDKSKYISKVITDFEIYLNIEADEKQIDKIKKEIANLEKYLSGIDKKLTNTNFLEKASTNVIEKEKSKRNDTAEKISKLKNMIK